MQTSQKKSGKIKVWAISDNRNGHIAQIKSIVPFLNKPYKLFILNNSWLGKLNYNKLPLGLKKSDYKSFQHLLDTKEMPDVLLVIGRRNLSTALYFKREIKKYNPSLKLIFLMPPGTVKHKDIDYIFMHKYKMQENKNYPTSVIGIDFSPTSINTEALESNFKKTLQPFKHLKPPYIGVIVGGKAKGAHWNKRVIKELVATLTAIAKENKASLLITTSRRSGKLSNYLYELLFNGNNLQADEHFFFDFNDSLDKENPYLNILAASNALVVTGESTSMIADCVLLPRAVPVFLFDSPAFMPPPNRFKKFHRFLYQNHYAQSVLNGNINIKNQKNIKVEKNSANIVADLINSCNYPC